MRKIIVFMAMAVLLCGCGSKNSDNAAERAKGAGTQTEQVSTDDSKKESADEKQNEDSAEETDDTEEKTAVDEKASDKEDASEEVSDDEDGKDEEAKEDAFSDYTEQIKKEVSEAVRSSDSLQEELKKIEKISDKYDKRFREEDGSQAELNARATEPYCVWDTELNNLWKRMKSSLDKDTMEDLLAEQRRWVSNKEHVAEEAVSEYEGGSIQPMLYTVEMTTVTRNRVYQLAFIFASAKGESFDMPKRPEIGNYIEDHGTGDIYSSLMIKIGLEGTKRASMMVYKLGSAEGTIKKDGDTLLFQCSEYGMKARITYSWDGATFEVLSAKEGPFHKGDIFEFPTAF